MASGVTIRPFQSVLRRARPTFECANSPTVQRQCVRRVSTTPSRPGAKWETEPQERPRWSYTPEGMKAPYPWRPRDLSKKFECNSDPKRLDQFYVNFLGPGGDQVLTEEVKWLAITHKSFDQGRRGFNDRLAFFGRRILNMQTNLALVQSNIAPGKLSSPPQEEDFGPLNYPELDGLENISKMPLGEVLTKERLSTLGTQLGIREIMRWQPRNPDKLYNSGVDVVINTCVYAIIGAIALQKGSAYANEVAREKILKHLGIV